MGVLQSSELKLPEALHQHVERQHRELQRCRKGFLTVFEVAAMSPTQELPADPADMATLFALDRKKNGLISLHDLIVFSTAQRRLLSQLSKTQPLELAVRGWTLRHFMDALLRSNDIESTEARASFYKACQEAPVVSNDTEVSKDDVIALQHIPEKCRGIEGMIRWFCLTVYVATAALEAEAEGKPMDNLPKELPADVWTKKVHPVAAQFCFQILQIPLAESNDVDFSSSPAAVSSAASSPVRTHRTLGCSNTELQHCQRIALHHFKTWSDLYSLIKGFLEGVIESHGEL